MAPGERVIPQHGPRRTVPVITRESAATVKKHHVAPLRGSTAGSTARLSKMRGI